MNCTYDLGFAPHCGLVKLPFPANAEGEYYIHAKTKDAIYVLSTPDITEHNVYFYLNASKLPVNRELTLNFFNRLDNTKETFNLTRNIGTDCDVENETKCFSEFKIMLKYMSGITDYSIEFPENEVVGSNLLYYDIRFVTGNTFVTTYNLPDFSLFTTVSVNASLRVWVDGIKYYWNENEQDFSDQIILNGNTISFLEAVDGGRVEVEFYDNLILK